MFSIKSAKIALYQNWHGMGHIRIHAIYQHISKYMNDISLALTQILWEWSVLTLPQAGAAS